MATFSILALLLATLGIYAVVSFAVAQRFSELGIRIAMGARRGQVIGLVVRETVRTVGFGVLVGFAVIVAAAPALEGLLFNIGTTDPLTFVGGAVILMGVAGLAAYIPARRAAGADPIQVLRRA
jgi:ABC-type antimicrobial peptide transport system permease subunit